MSAGYHGYPRHFAHTNANGLYSTISDDWLQPVSDEAVDVTLMLLDESALPFFFLGVGGDASDDFGVPNDLIKLELVFSTSSRSSLPLERVSSSSSSSLDL